MYSDQRHLCAYMYSHQRHLLVKMRILMYTTVKFDLLLSYSVYTEYTLYSVYANHGTLKIAFSTFITFVV